MTDPPIQRALLSASDKSGLLDFARGLASGGISLYSTGGTRRHLTDAGLTVHDVAEYTGFPEMLDGRVKTLHPKIHGGILARHDREDDLAALAAAEIVTFELVVVNLYPFAETIARDGVTDDEAIEQIDIGGPSMIRAAAKNHAFITLVTDKSQYDEVLAALESADHTSLPLRRRLAAAAFKHTARYDRMIADYFARTTPSPEAATEEPTAESTAFPAQLNLQLTRRATLRYGENPHQQAALYAEPSPPLGSVVQAQKRNGKELSYNNLLDLEAAWGIVRAHEPPTVAVIKHNNPCGAAAATDLADAARRALDGDRTSAFGSILAVNRPLDATTAEVLVEPGTFIEAIAAPSYNDDAFEILTTRPKWKSNVRLMELGPAVPSPPFREFRRLEGGFLCQDADVGIDPQSEWSVVTETSPSDEQLSDLRFAWSVVRFVKSNAIIVCAETTLRGVGAGQMSRVDSTQIALSKAGEHARGAAIASDAFFPFPDSIDTAAEHGIVAIIQPGGSRNDPDVIAACNRHGLAMIFTGRRHFKH